MRAAALKSTAHVMASPVGSDQPQVLVAVTRGQKTMGAGFTEPEALALFIQQLVQAGQQTWPNYGKPTDDA